MGVESIGSLLWHQYWWINCYPGTTKIKFEHIYLTSFFKMRVDLAAQVSMLLSALSYV